MSVYEIITSAATKWSVNPTLALSIAEHESSFIAGAINDTAGDARRGGSYGLFQMSYATAKDLGYKGDTKSLLDPATNANFACRLLHMLSVRKLETVPYSLSDVICAYNSGRPVAKAPHSTLTVYLPAVMHNYNKWVRLL